MTQLFDQFAIVGDPLDDVNKVVHLLASLPKSYDMLVSPLEASPDVPKIEVVTERLLHEETKQKEGIQQNEKAMASKLNRRNQEKDQYVIYAKNVDISSDIVAVTRSSNVTSQGTR